MDSDPGSTEPREGSEKNIRALKVLIVIICIVATLAGIAGAAYYFFIDVRLTDRAKSEEIYNTAMKLMRERDKVPWQDNGYSVLADITGRAATDKAKEPYRALSKYCVGKTADIELEIQKDRKQTAVDVKKFSIAPAMIEKTVEKRFFYPPSKGDFSIGALVPNYIVMRAIAQGLAVNGIYLEMNGKPREAARNYLLAIRYGALIGTNGTLITQMISVAIEAIGSGPLLVELSKGSLKKDDYLHIIAALEALPIEKDNFLKAMDEEYARTLNTLDDMSAGRGNFLNTGAIMPGQTLQPGRIKFILEREKKIYMNVHLRYRPCYETLTVPKDLGINIESDMKALRRKLSIISPILIPNFTRAILQKRMMLTRIAALKVVAALQAYKIDRGAYPPELKDLCPGYLKEVPQDYMSKDKCFIYALKGKSFTLSSRSDYYADLSMSDPLFFYPPDRRMF
jgi:hypothetical protein